MLLTQFRQTIGSNEDEDFREAINQSLILIGEPALLEILNINRKASNDIEVILATQPIIYHFMTADKEAFSSGRYDLTDVVILDQDFSYHDLSGLNLEGVQITNSNLCQADLQNTFLVDAKFYNSIVGGADFEGASLDEDTRQYLCEEGASNIPGGCDDILSEENPNSEGTGARCF